MSMRKVCTWIYHLLTKTGKGAGWSTNTVVFKLGVAAPWATLRWHQGGNGSMAFYEI